jgi:DNA-binding transcriptional regulator YhcF (GntR family)
MNERIPLINYVYKIKDENKAELEIQQIIQNYNSLEKLISERKLMKDLNIENETISKLYTYFNDKNNKDFLIKIFGKENYEFALKYINENIEDNKTAKTKGIRKEIKFNQNNTQENYSEIKNQINIENEDSNLLTISTKFQSFESKNMNNNSEQTKSFEEKLAKRILKKSEVILNTKKVGEKLIFTFESVSYGDHHIFISYEKLLNIKKI